MLNIKVRDDIARYHALFSGVKLESFVKIGNEEWTTSSVPFHSVASFRLKTKSDEIFPSKIPIKIHSIKVLCFCNT